MWLLHGAWCRPFLSALLGRLCNPPFPVAPSCPRPCPCASFPFVSCPRPLSRGYTPPGRLQTLSTGPLDPHSSRDRRVPLARVALYISPSYAGTVALGFFRVLWRPFSFVPRPHPVLISHRAASYPVERAGRTVSCPLYRLLLSVPLGSLSPCSVLFVFLCFCFGSLFCAHPDVCPPPPCPLCVSFTVPSPGVSFFSLASSASLSQPCRPNPSFSALSSHSNPLPTLPFPIGRNIEGCCLKVTVRFPCAVHCSV